jgi:hypothetical protein
MDPMKTTEKGAGLFNYISFRILRPNFDTFVGIGILSWELIPLEELILLLN